MIRTTSAALLLLLLTVTGVVAWLGFEAHRVLVHLDGAIVRGEAIETKANATLINLDKGTATWAASAKEQTQAITELATDAHGTLSEADRALQGINPVTSALTDEVGALHKTTDAATTGVQALTTTIQTADHVITNLQAPIDGFTQDAADLDALLKDNAIHRTLEATATTSEQIAGVSTDLRKVTDKATADYLTPKPWYTKMGRFASDAFDYGALAARHIP